MKETVTANKASNQAQSGSKTNKKALLIGGISLLLAAGAGYGIYYFFFRDKEDEDYSDGESGTKKSSRTYTNRDYPLSFGTHHPDVGVLQLYLKKTYNANLGNYGKNKDGVDAKFGKVTKEAAMKHLKKVSFTKKDIAGMKAALKFIKV